MTSGSFIKTAPALKALAGELGKCGTIAIDTESNSFHNYHERICLIQISTPRSDFIIDPLAVTDLSPLSEIFEAPGIQKIFHAAENDVVLLKKHHGFEFQNVFDTLLAAQILGHREVGLASLLARFFDIRLDKGPQRSDWARRPLSAVQLEYAIGDTRHLSRLRDALHKELVETDRLSAAEEEFERLAAKRPVERQPDPAAYLRIKGARKLPDVRRGILQKLFAWRESTARSIDRPPFRVISNETLIELSRLAPSSWEGKGRIRGVTPGIISRFGDDILAAIRRGLAEGEAPPPRSERRNRRPQEKWTDEMEGRFRRLREWRNERSKTQNVEPFIVAANRLLVNLARLDPDSVEALRKIPGMSEWRVKDFGGEILDVLKKPAD